MGTRVDAGAGFAATLEIRQNLPYLSRLGDGMPTVAEFGEYRIVIYFDDHNPPHVHVIAADFEGLVTIADATLMAGQIPPKFRREALDWIKANRRLLIEKWNACH